MADNNYTVYVKCDNKFYNCPFTVQYYDVSQEKWVPRPLWNGNIDDNTNSAYVMGKFNVDESEFDENKIPYYFRITVNYTEEQKTVSYIREINTKRNTDVWVDDTTNAYITKIRLTDGKVYNIADTTSDFAKWINFDDGSIIPSDKGVFNIPNAAVNKVYGVTSLNSSVNLDNETYAATPKAVREAYNKTMYGTSSTAAETATKIVTCAGFILSTGTRVAIKFTNAHKSNVTTAVTTKLNVNGTGAINVSYNNTTSITDMLWGANETVNFIYNGSQWIMIKDSKATTNLYGITKLQGSIDITKSVENGDVAATPEAVRSIVQDARNFTQEVKNDLETLNGKYNTHTHGNISNDGKIGSNANYAVYTTNNGVLTAGTLATSSPSASSETSTTFIDTISQDSKGKITATKKIAAVDLSNINNADNLKVIEALTGTGILQKVGNNQWNLTTAAGTGTITAVQANGENVATEGTANIPAASISKYGVTKLSDSVSSTDNDKAATPSAVKKAYDLANKKPDIVVSSSEPTTKVTGDFWYEIL